MLTWFDWLAIVIILGVTFAGGWLPLMQPQRARDSKGFPGGQAFAAGVFLALCMLIMLPAAFGLLGKAYPGLNFPLASCIAIVMFILLLRLEHWAVHVQERDHNEAGLSSPLFPIVMTTMIAIPSFFLGAALGVSGMPAALMIFLAIIIHKGTAAFALALKMARSTMARKQRLLLFTCFACSTPLGILVGRDVHSYITGPAAWPVKGVILAMAAGTFLYMATLHDLHNSPLIADCGNSRGFKLMLVGFAVTALVRVLIGQAHHM